MIRIRAGVTLTEKQARVVYKIQQYTLGISIDVTRGISSPEDQLSVIAKYARMHNISFPEFDEHDLHTKMKNPDGGDDIYTWQRTWSKLLNEGVIINPPLVAKCLYEYKGEVGRTIWPSPHITSDPIDFGGGTNIDAVADVLMAAMRGGVGIRNIVVERKNNCVHCDLSKEA